MSKKKTSAAGIETSEVAAAASFATGSGTATYVVMAAIVVGCVVVYGQTLGFDFIGLDDDLYVSENAAVTRGVGFAGLKWALTTFHAANWHPLTWLSHQFDASLFGLEAGGHHAVNLIFHIANSLLVFVLLRRLTGAFWRCAFVAAIFAVHPAHVESVAWVAERKDVFSTLFWLLSTFSYVAFVRSDDAARRTKYYIVAVILFALGLTAKPMLVTLPFTLLLLDFWPLRRIATLSELTPRITEKLPFFILAAISSVITIVAQKTGGAVQALETISFGDRVMNSTAAYLKYVAMFFYPSNLGVWYPFESGIGLPVVLAAAAFVLLVSVVAIWQIRERPFLLTGWLWFLGTLVPVIGLVQVGRQSMADRYTYVPYIGLAIVVVWLVAELCNKLKLNRMVAGVGGLVVVLAMTALAARQTAYWKNSETLFTQTLAVTGRNYLVKNNFCRYLERRNRLDEATAQCRAAIADDPTLPPAYNTLGTVQLKQNRFDDARASFLKAIEIKPDFALAYANVAIAETNRGDLDAASAAIGKALQTGGEEFRQSGVLADAYGGIALAAYKTQHYDRAAEFFQKSLEIAPGNADYQRNLGVALHLQGRSAEGERILLDLIGKKPNLPEAYNSLGLIYIGQNRRDEAAAQFKKALQIDPGFTPAQGNLRKLMEQK